MSLPSYTPEGIDIEAADFGDIVLHVRKDYLNAIDELIATRARLGEVNVTTAPTLRAGHNKRAAIALFMVELCERREEDHANSLFNSISSCYQWEKVLSAVPFHWQGFDYRVEISLDHILIVEFDHLSFEHIEDGRPSRNPCPISETGYKSAHVWCGDVNDAGSYMATIESYFKAHAPAPTVKELQRCLF